MPRFGPITQSILISGTTADIPVVSTGVTYTDPFNMRNIANFGVDYKATSDGSVNVKIELEQGSSAPTNFDRYLQIVDATIANAADSDWVEGESISDVDDVTDENQHHASLAPVVGKYGRFKLTGGVGNDASTTVAIALTKIEEF